MRRPRIRSTSHQRRQLDLENCYIGGDSDDSSGGDYVGSSGGNRGEEDVRFPR